MLSEGSKTHLHSEIRDVALKKLAGDHIRHLMDAECWMVRGAEMDENQA